MNEQHTGAGPPAAPPGAGTGWPDWVLATKLYVPRPQPEAVARPRLLGQLDQAMALGVVLVCAPAGFGKTLPLARLRGRGQLGELRAADVRFTVEETAALLGSVAGPGLPGAAAEALAERTEGWVAGLQLAGLSLRGRADAAEFVASFSGSHRYVLDYLTEEVLNRQPDQVRGFLLETSVLERLSGRLCDAVTGRTDGQRLLEWVERYAAAVLTRATSRATRKNRSIWCWHAC